MSDILDHRVVKTRKKHFCHGCLEPIPIGTKADCAVIADEGTVYRSYLCLDCVSYCKKNPSVYDYSEDRMMMEGFVNEYKRETMEVI